MLVLVCHMKINSSRTNAGNLKVHSTWFFNNVVNLKLTEHGRIYKICHVRDTENLLEKDNLEEYINICIIIYNDNNIYIIYIYIYIYIHIKVSF